MAERRMFSKSIIDSDIFLDMPLSTQCLYFHLSMRADDDGFVNKTKRIMRMIGSSDDDLRILIAKNFVLPFESGLVVITHWKVHNYIQKDRYRPSTEKEKLLITVGKSGIYEYLPEENSEPLLEQKCIQPVSKVDTCCTQDGYVGKDRLGKVRLDNNTCSFDKQMNADLNTNLNKDFEMIWSLYPRKQGRKRAFEAFKRSLKHGATVEEIKSGVQRYNEHIRVNRIEQQFIKMGSTFFTNESWADEYPVNSSENTCGNNKTQEFMDFEPF